MSFSPKDLRPSNFPKMIFDASTLTLVSFIYLCLLDKMLQMIKVKLLQSFEDFYVANSIQIHSFDNTKNLQNSEVASL